MSAEAFNQAIQVIPYALVGIFVMASGVWQIPADYLFEKYARRFICPKKGHNLIHVRKGIWVMCNLGREHLDHYEDTPATWCTRCGSQFPK